MSTPTIKKLDKTVVNRIAAGEVKYQNSVFIDNMLIYFNIGHSTSCKCFKGIN